MRRRPAGIVAWDKLANVRKLIATADGAPVISTIGLTLDLPIPTVAANPTGIAEIVAGHLVEEGLRNLLFVGPKNHPPRGCGSRRLRPRCGGGFRRRG